MDCQWVASNQHPDGYWVAPAGESKQIVVDQVRATISDLVLTSHTGRGKVAVFDPADALNANAANALLKTLEEPSQKTLLILVSPRPSRLPATVRSRCQQLRIVNPPRGEAARWLEARKPTGQWDAALAITGLGPLALTESDPGEIIAAQRDVAAALQALLDGRSVPPAIADAWARGNLDLRLACTERWLTDRVYAAAGVVSDSTEVGAATHLPVASKALNIRLLLELETAVRELRTLLTTSINKSYAVESLLWRWAQVRPT
jgi:DNA polymerase-3 subunit delta'